MTVAIFPYTFVTKVHNKQNNKFKPNFDKFLKSVVEVQSNVFQGTNTSNTGIYVFDKNKTNNQNIQIIDIDKNKQVIKSLSDIQEFTNYENQIIQYLEKQGSQTILCDCGRLNSWKAEINNLDENDKKVKIKELVENSLKKLKKHYNDNKTAYGLLVNKSNGNRNGKAISSKNGQIFDTYNDFVNYFCNHLIGAGYNILMFKTNKEAENCKIAIQNPILRFTFYKLQDDQNMTVRVYKYIPNIDWSNDKVKTDEGLLEVCGCPIDKCKEYADYCKKYIEKVDNGTIDK